MRVVRGLGVKVLLGRRGGGEMCCVALRCMAGGVFWGVSLGLGSWCWRGWKLEVTVLAGLE